MKSLIWKASIMALGLAAASCSRNAFEARMAPVMENGSGISLGRGTLRKEAVSSLMVDEVLSSQEPMVNIAGNDQATLDQTDRKLIRTANVRIRVTDLDSSEATVRELVEKAGGYIASSNRSEESIAMSLRVPHTSFETILAGLQPLGKELWRTISTEDVSLNWFDLSSRLETKKELLVTLRGYLRSAKTIEDIMAVETRLSDLQNEIDNLGGEFRRLSDLVDFATIDVDFTLPEAQISRIEPTLGERIGAVLRSTGTFFSVLVTGLVAAVIFGVPIVAVLALLYWLLFGRIGLIISLFRALSRKQRTK